MLPRLVGDLAPPLGDSTPDAGDDAKGRADPALSFALSLMRGASTAAIYGWFTEGFDTADLKEAKALLDELN